jgi:hypothetical protein
MMMVLMASAFALYRLTRRGATPDDSSEAAA